VEVAVSNPLSGFFGMLGRLFQSGSDRIADPAYALDRAYAQQMQALEETRRGRLEIETISTRLDMESRQIVDGVAACEDQARRALLAGRDDLARVSLGRREELDEQLTRTQTERDRLEEERQSLFRQESELAGAVQAFRSRKEVLKAQYGAAQARLRVGEALTGYSKTVTAVGEDVRHFEERLMMMRARSHAVETMSIGTASGSTIAPAYVERELRIMGMSPRIEDQLQRMRGELGLPEPPESIAAPHLESARIEAPHVDVPRRAEDDADVSRMEATR
jgi:phage shock protein A